MGTPTARKTVTGIADTTVPSFSRALVSNVVGIVAILGVILLIAMVAQSVISTEKSSRGAAMESVERVAERLQILILAMEMTAESAERAAHTRNLSSATLTSSLEYSLAAFEQRPELSYLGFSLPDTGEYGALQRDGEGEIFLWLFPPPTATNPSLQKLQLSTEGFVRPQTLPAEAYDPRTARFYQAALDSPTGEAWVAAYPWKPPFAPDSGLWGISYVKTMSNDNGRFFGVVDTDLDLPAVNAFVRTLGREYRTHVQVIELGDTPQLIGDNDVTNAPLPVPGGLRPLLDVREDTSARRMTLGGERRWVAASPVVLKGGLSWLVVTSRPAPLIEPSLRKQIYVVTVMVLLLVAGLLWISIRMARRFGEPVAVLEKRVDSISWRDIDIPRDAKTAVADDFRETQLLGAALDRMEVAVKQLFQAREDRDASLALKGAIFDSSRTAIFSIDHRLSVIEWNNAAERLFGSTRDDALGRSIAELVRTPDDSADWPVILQASGTDAYHFIGAQGPFDAELRVASFKREGLDVHTLFLEDISERKRAEQRIRYLATFDGLTGLPNRELIHDRIAQAMAHARRTDRPLALLYLDLDRFKVLNDGFGHPFGDAVLKAIAERLCTLVREADTVSRRGGDEFLILLADLQSPSDAYSVATKIVESLDQPIVVKNRTVHLSASIGVSVFPQDGDTAEELIENADVAMYRAKDLGRNNCQFFTRQMSEETLHRVTIETQLREAVSENQFTLVYQPKVSLRSGQITGCEALLRWHHPRMGMVPPAQFIPIAESSGLIVPIGDWVLRTACAQARSWSDAGLPPVSVAVNISTRQFLKLDVVSSVMQALRDAGLPPAQLVLELTESLMAQDADKVIVTLNQLSDEGVKFSIDDFGIGYSNLSYLKRFRVNTLKIDQSFVRDMLVDPEDETIVLAVIALAHNLGCRVIAEGVETEEQCQFLRNNDCDELQGFYFSKPLPAAEFEALLRNGKQLP